MDRRNCTLIGCPVDCGKRQQGCLMGPDAFRAAGLREILEEIGMEVTDIGNVRPEIPDHAHDPSSHIYRLRENIAWSRLLEVAAYSYSAAGIPIFLGGDHAVSLGSVSGVARYAAKVGQPLFVLWLDAHSDFHTPGTSVSGHMHGTPVAYFTGRDGFHDFPELISVVPTSNVCMFGLRSVDREERESLSALDIAITDMRALDETGIVQPLSAFLNRVRDANGRLHVSLDVDFLDPAVAPAVGTTVPGGATIREAHLTMEILHESELVTSLDLVELNPLLDHQGKTAQLLIDLAASLFGRKVFDRPTWRPVS